MPLVPVARAELALLAAVAALFALAVFGPAVAQHADYHAFADQATRWGVPHALDVLTNLPFACVAAVGAWRLARSAPTAPRGAERTMAWLFVAGLALTSVGSAWYHLRPDDARLVADRGAMAVAFAGLLGVLACRVSPRAGWVLGAVLLLLGPLSLHVWRTSGNLLPWSVLQGGGLLLVAALACLRPAHAVLPVRWWLVIAAYVVAKVLEASDHAVWQLSDGWVSGHNLKHLIAALAAWPLVAALGTQASGRQNAPLQLRTAR